MGQGPLRVEVEGMGVVEFPEGTTESQMMTALQTARRDIQRGQPTWLDSLKDFGVGVMKGAGEGAVNAGKLWHMVPGVSKAVDTLYGQPGLSEQAFKQADADLEPTNAAQSAGKMTEQIGEALVPSKALANVGAKIATAAPRLANAARVGIEAVAGGATAAYQGGDPTTGAVLGGAFPAIGAGVRAGRNAILGGVKHTPQMAEAVALGAREGVPLDAATATGRPIVSVIQKRVGDSIGGAGIAEEFQGRQAEALTRTGQKLADAVHPSAVSPEEAGRGVRAAVTKQVDDAAGAADAAYDKLRAIEADPRSLRMVTMKMEPGGHDVQVEMPLPVDLRGVKQALKPIYEQMVRQMPPTQRDASKGFASLKAIMESHDFMPASIIDTDLGQIKSIVREADMPSLRNRSQGLAAVAVKELDKAVRDAVAIGGPDATAALNTGRAATVKKFGAAGVLDQLRDEPVQLFNQATMKNDAGIDRLREVAKLAPGEMPKVGRAFVEGLLDVATDEGGFSRAQKLYAEWGKLGPETKKLLYPNPQHRQDLDSFFLLAKKIGENPNPSGTARVTTAFNLMSTVPAYVLAKVLYSPAGVRQLTKGITAGNPSQVRAALGRVAASQAAQQ